MRPNRSRFRALIPPHVQSLGLQAEKSSGNVLVIGELQGKTVCTVVFCDAEKLSCVIFVTEYILIKY